MSINDRVAAHLAEEFGLTKKRAKEIWRSALYFIQNELKQNGQMKLYGIGTLKVAHRAARVVKSPIHNEPIHVPASYTVVFKPEPGFKQIINEHHNLSVALAKEA